jgi:signal peptidase II
MSAAAQTSAALRPRRSPLSISVCLVALAVCTWADLGSKQWAQTRLSRAQPPSGKLCVPIAVGTPYERIEPQRRPLAPLVLVPDYLELAYAENCGAAFSMLVGSPAWVRTALFAPAAIAATIGLLWLFVTGYGGRLFAISVPLIASGAIGNLVDRFRLGYVVDFIHAFFIRNGVEHSWPTFNVADSTITVGVILLLIEGFLSPQKAPATQADAARKAQKPAQSPGQ